MTQSAVQSEPAPSAPMFEWRTFDPAMIQDDGGYSFADELTTYRDRLPELLEHQGSYVVIKGREVIGLFPDRGQALREAVERFGAEPALVKQVVAEQPIAVIGRAIV